MEIFSEGVEYRFNDEWAAEFVHHESGANERMYYFKNMSDLYRVTVVRHLPEDDWSMMVSRLDGTHETLTEPLLAPLKLVRAAGQPSDQRG